MKISQRATSLFIKKRFPLIRLLYYLPMEMTKKEEKKSELKRLPKKDQKNVNETLELLKKYYPNIETDKVDLEKWWVHLKNWEKWE